MIIIGPSASGKTDLAIQIAKNLHKDIISADSRQIYTGLDYSTGKLPLKYRYTKRKQYWNIEGIKYWGYGVAKPSIKESEFNYVGFVYELLNSNDKYDNNSPIVCGGTGLYVNQLLKNKTTTPVPPNYSLRKTLGNMGAKDLLTKLKSYKYNINLLNNSEKHNTQRLIRKIEKEEYYMENPNIINKSQKINPYAGSSIIGLRLQPESYDKKIANWVNDNFEYIKNEVEWLNNKYPKSHLLKGFIFKEALGYINNQTTIEETKKLIFYSYKHYIKRQITYFNKYFPNTKWFFSKEEAYNHAIQLFS